MKFYLSSSELGDETEKLKALVPRKAIGYVPNALDVSRADPERRERRIEKDVSSLHELDLAVEMIDLRDYFGKQVELRDALSSLGAIFVSGGNVFVLRQAMRLSGLDAVLRAFRDRRDFLYAGYSAAGCVLAPDLKAYGIADEAETPYSELKEVIWEGLGFVDFALMPHWTPESAEIEREIEFCRQNDIAYKAIRDGEVLIIEE